MREFCVEAWAQPAVGWSTGGPFAEGQVQDQGSVCGCGCNKDASVYLSQRHAYQGHSVDAESAGLGHRYRIIEPLPFLIAGSLVIDAVSNLHSEHVLRIWRVRRATSCVP